MIPSGSLAKGTALRSLNDIDVAVYISGSDAPQDLRGLLDYLADRLRKAFPNFSPDQVKPQTYSVTVSFRGSGLDVDIVPVLYSGLPDWRGHLISQKMARSLKPVFLCTLISSKPASVLPRSILLRLFV